MQANPQYRVEQSTTIHGHFTVVDHRGLVDDYRGRRSAEAMAELLNDGRAVVHPHATLGCRVEVVL